MPSVAVVVVVVVAAVVAVVRAQPRDGGQRMGVLLILINFEPRTNIKVQALLFYENHIFCLNPPRTMNRPLVMLNDNRIAGAQKEKAVIRVDLVRPGSAKNCNNWFRSHLCSLHVGFS